MTDYPQPKRRRFRPLRWIFALLLILAAAFVALWLSPLSTDGLNKRLLASLEQFTGAKAEFKSAEFRLAKGLYEIRGLKLTARDASGSAMLAADHVLIHATPWGFLFGRKGFIREVEINRPSPLEIQYDRSGPHFGPTSGFLRRMIIKARTTTEKQTGITVGRLPFETLRIKDAQFTLSEADSKDPASEDNNAADRALSFSGNLEVSNAGAGEIMAQFTGSGYVPDLAKSGATPHERPVASGIEAAVSLRHRDRRDEYKLEAMIANASLPPMFRNLPGTAASAAGLHIAVEGERTAQGVTARASLDCAELDLRSVEHSIEIHDEAIKASLDCGFTSSPLEIALNHFSAQSQLLDMSSSGSLSLEGEREYAGRVSATRMGGGYRAMLTKLLPPGWALKAPDDAVRVAGAVEGNRSAATKLTGDVSFSSVTITARNFDQPLHELAGTIAIMPNEIRFADLRGIYGRTRVALNGTFSGDYLTSGEGNLDLEWNAAATASDLIQLIPRKGAAGQAATNRQGLQKPQGAIDGSGTYRQQVSLRASGHSAIPAIGGTVRLTDVGFAHSSLPGPVRKLNGTMSIQGNVLDVERLSGEMGGNPVAVDGVLIGNQTFWDDPTVSATLATSVDLTKLDSLLPAAQAQLAASHHLSGIANTQLDLSGKLSDLGGARFTGILDLDNASFDPGLNFMAGSFTAVDAELEWNGKSLIFRRFDGLLNGDALKVTGMLNQEKVSLRMAGTLDLDVFGMTFPKLGSVMRMSGPADYDVTFAAGNQASTVEAAYDPLPMGDEAGGSEQLASMFSTAAALINRAVEEKSFLLEGRVNFKGANIRHHSMPPAHEVAGRNAPEAEIRNLRGSARIDGDTLLIPENEAADCEFTGAKECRVSGSLQIRPKNFPALKARISSAQTINVDSWITAWGKAMPKRDAPPDSGKSFELRVSISAPGVVYKNERAGRSTAAISFHMTQDGTPRRTSFDEIVINGAEQGLGQIRATGEILSFAWKPSEFPKWNCQIESDQMPLQSMLNSIFEEPTRLSGIATGQIALSGIGGNARSIRGAGSASFSNLVIGRTTVMEAVDQRTGRSVGGRTFQTASATRYDIGNGAISSRDLQLETNGLRVDIRGDYYFAGNPSRNIPDGTLDCLMRLNFFKSVFGQIPLLNGLAGIADEVAGVFLFAFRITGTTANPNISTIPLPLFTGGLPTQ